MSRDILTPPGEPDDRAVENMRTQLFTETEVSLNQPTKTVGNNGVMALLQELRQMAERLSKVEKSKIELEKSKAEHERQIQSIASSTR